MEKQRIGIIAAVAVALGLSLVVYNRFHGKNYVPAADEIALQIQVDTKEDIGLLVYDYQAGGRTYSGGISDADGSLIKRDSENIVVLNREELNQSDDSFELSMQFRVITEYVTPNFENIYPEEITKFAEPIAWEAGFGETYHITITGNRVDGYKAVLN